MQGMFLHVLADTMGSVAVIVSALLIDNFGWHWADPLCSLFLSILIFASIYPVLKDSGLILLQRCPPSIETQLPTALQKVRDAGAPGDTGMGRRMGWDGASGCGAQDGVSGRSAQDGVSGRSAQDGALTRPYPP